MIMRKTLLLLSVIALTCSSFSQGIQKIPGNSKIIYFGDSQTSFGYGSGTNSVSFQNYGYIAWVNAIATGVYMPKGGMQGVGGETTSGMINRLGALQGLGAKFLVVMAGTNDPLYAIGPTTTENNLRKIYNAGIAAGMKVIAVTIMPRFAPNAYDATTEANRKLINAWIKSQTDIVAVDVENDVNDPKYFIDGLHNSPIGAYVVGNKVATEINKLVATCSPGSPFSTQQTLSSNLNPLMAGSNGRKDNVTGSVATGYQLAAIFSGGATVSGAKEATPDGTEKQVINISGMYKGSTSKVTFNTYSSATNFSGLPVTLATGDLVEGVAEIEITTPLVGVKDIYLSAIGYAPDISMATQGYSMWPTSNLTNNMPPGKYILRTPTMTIGSVVPTTVSLQINIEFIGTGTVDPVSASMKITSMGLLRIPLNDGPLATISPAGNQSVCPGTTVQLNAGAGNGYTYQWALNGTKLKDSIAASINAKDPGAYTVTVTTPGCSVVSDVTTIAPGTNCPTGNTIQTGALPTVLCSGQSLVVPFSSTGTYDQSNTFTAQLSDGKGSFANPTTIGSAANGTSVTTSIPSSLTPDIGYRIRVVSSSPLVNGSNNGQDIRISTPPKASVTPTGSVTSYVNLPATLTAGPQGGYTYQWLLDGVNINQNGTAATYTPTASGQYRVVVTSQDGCSDSSKAAVVTVNPCSEIALAVSATDTTQITFTPIGGIPPYQYALDNGNYQSSNTFTGLQSSRTYTVSVKDSVNCIKKLFYTTKAAQTISFGSLANKTISDAPFALTATASSGLPVSYRVVTGPATVSGNTVTLTGSNGTVTIEASQAGDGNYYTAPVVTQSFNVTTASVTKTNQTILFGALPDKTYGDAPFVLSATASSGLPVSYRVVSGPASVAGNVVTLTGAGAITLEASQIGNDAYNPASPVLQSFNVAKAQQTISFASPGDKTFGDSPFALSATASSSLPVDFSVIAGPASVTGNIVSITGAGPIIIQASQAGNGNYQAATSLLQSFTSFKATQTINFAPLADKAYGDAPFLLTATASSGLPVSYRILSGPATVSGNTVTITGTGSVSIEASQVGNDNYAAAVAMVQNFTVKNASQTLTFGPVADKTFGDAPFALTATASSGLPVTYRVVSGPASVSGNIVTINGAGLVTIEASQSGNSSYGSATPVTQSFNVAKAAQNITFASLPNKIYGDVPFALTATTSSGFPVLFRVVSGPANIMGNVVTLTGIGTVIIEASQAGDANYNAAVPVQRSFIVTSSNTTKLNQSITFGTLAYQTYTSPPFTLTATTSSGLPVSYRAVSGPITITGNIVTITGVGPAIIEASQPGDATYNPATPVQRSFTIGKASQTISFANLPNKIYSDAPFALTATATSGLPVNYRIVSGPATVSGNIVTITGVGTVTVEASQPGNANYNAAAYPVQRSFIVTKGNQSITFPAIFNMTNEDPPFALSATASSGLPVTYRVVSGPASIAGNVVTILGIGTVTIEASQPGDANYNAAAPVSRAFSVVATHSIVTKLGQTINFDPISDMTYGEAPFVLTATATSGLPVSYRIVSGPAVVSADTIKLTGAGVVTIEASQTGDATFNPAPPVSNTFNVAKSSQNIKFASISSKIFGEPPFTLTATASSGLPVTFRVVAGPATISGTTVNLTGTGTVTVEATQAGDVNYDPALPVQRSFTVMASGNTKLNQIITFGTLPYQTFVSPPFALAATTTSGLPVSYRIVSGPVTLSGNVVTITGVGSVTIEASQAGDATYNAAPPVQRSFTVGKAGQTISFSLPATKTYGDPPFALTATTSSGLPVSYRVVSGPATVSGNLVTITGMGTVLLEASQPGNTNFNAAYPIQRSFTAVAPTTLVKTTGLMPGHVTATVQETSLSLASENRVMMVPNPVVRQGLINVSVGKSGTGLVTIYNMQGRLVKSFGNRRFEKGLSVQIKFDTDDLASGMYILQLTINGKTASQVFEIVK
jgi:hypothetical protein